MVNKQLINNIKTEEAQGYTPEQLRKYLVKQGHNPIEVDEAIKYANAKNIYPPSQDTSNSKKLKPTSNGIKRRDPLIVLILTLITLGVYGLVVK